MQYARIDGPPTPQSGGNNAKYLSFFKCVFPCVFRLAVDGDPGMPLSLCFNEYQMPPARCFYGATVPARLQFHPVCFLV